MKITNSIKGSIKNKYILGTIILRSLFVACEYIYINMLIIMPNMTIIIFFIII
jgi:hypothetical protein